MIMFFKLLLANLISLRFWHLYERHHLFCTLIILPYFSEFHPRWYSAMCWLLLIAACWLTAVFSFFFLKNKFPSSTYLLSSFQFSFSQLQVKIFPFVHSSTFNVSKLIWIIAIFYFNKLIRIETQVHSY